MRMQFVGVAALTAASLTAWGQSGVEKSAFNVDVDGIYGRLQSSYGAPFAPGADLDNDGNADAGQANVLEFQALAGDDEDEHHEDVHDGWIDNFVQLRNIFRTETALSEAVIQDTAEVLAMFLVIDGAGMEDFVEDLYTNGLGITDPAFGDLEFVHFDDHEHGEEEEHEHEEGSGISHGGIFEVGSSLFLTIPGAVNESAPIQWFKDGQPLSDLGGIRLGTTSRTLEIYYLELQDSGLYSASYDNGAKAITSFGPVSITVVEASGAPAAGVLGIGALAIAMAGAAAYALRRKSA